MTNTLIKNEKIKKAIADIVYTIVGYKESILLTPYHPENDEENADKETFQIVVDKEVHVLVHAKGIRVDGPCTEKNLSLGLEQCQSYQNRKRAYKIFPLDEGQKVGEVINQMDGY